MKKRKPNIGAMTLKQLYYKIWIASNKKSYISGLPLEGYYNSAFQLDLFAHVLPKAQNKFPFFKFYGKNVGLVTPEEHFYWDDPSSQEARKQYALNIETTTKGKYTVDWSKFESLEEELKAEYDKFFPEVDEGIIWKYTEEEVAKVIGKLNQRFFIS